MKRLEIRPDRGEGGSYFSEQHPAGQMLLVWLTADDRLMDGSAARRVKLLWLTILRGSGEIPRKGGVGKLNWRCWVILRQRGSSMTAVDGAQCLRDDAQSACNAAQSLSDDAQWLRRYVQSLCDDAQSTPARLPVGPGAGVRRVRGSGFFGLLESLVDSFPGVGLVTVRAG